MGVGSQPRMEKASAVGARSYQAHGPACVWEAVRPSGGLGPCDPLAKHRPSVVPSGLSADT